MPSAICDYCNKEMSFCSWSMPQGWMCSSCYKKRKKAKRWSHKKRARPNSGPRAWRPKGLCNFVPDKMGREYVDTVSVSFVEGHFNTIVLKRKQGNKNTADLRRMKRRLQRRLDKYLCHAEEE